MKILLSLSSNVVTPVTMNIPVSLLRLKGVADQIMVKLRSLNVKRVKSVYLDGDRKTFNVVLLVDGVAEKNFETQAMGLLKGI